MSIFVLFPMSINKEIVKHKTNFLNLIGVLFTISIVINLVYIALKQPLYKSKAKLMNYEGFGKTLPIAFMSFTNHFRLDLFHAYIINPSPELFHQIKNDISFLSFLVFTLVGLSSSLIFSISPLDPSLGNFLLQMPCSQPLTGLCIFMMIYNVLLQMPTGLLPMKGYLMEIIGEEEEKGVGIGDG
jgi:ABC-type uncharacterized transport system fused permease/ATPase subunit